MLSRYDIIYECRTHRGNIRDNNEDNILCAGKCLPEAHDRGAFDGRLPCGDRKALFGVFDGIGGEAYGEVASFLAAKRGIDAGRPARLPSGMNSLAEEMNLAIVRWAREEGVSATGTTAALAAFTNSEAVLCNIGDSRIYLFRDGVLRQLSEDHVVPIPGREKGYLSQCLGMDPEQDPISPAVFSVRLRPGDRFLLCSDGLTDMLSDEKISAIMRGKICPADTLVEEALLCGGRDNITVIHLRSEKRPFLGRLRDLKG